MPKMAKNRQKKFGAPPKIEICKNILHIPYSHGNQSRNFANQQFEKKAQISRLPFAPGYQ